MANKIPAMKEAEFTAQVLELAGMLGWKRLHIRPARTKESWRTPVAGDGDGFPDLLLVRKRDGRCIAAELKIGKNKPTPAQIDWLENFAVVRGFETFVWYPENWQDIQEILR